MDPAQIIGVVAGFGTTFAALPDLIANAETAFQRRHEPQNGSHHGNFSDPLGDLWRVNRFEEYHHVECGSRL